VGQGYRWGRVTGGAGLQVGQVSGGAYVSGKAEG